MEFQEKYQTYVDMIHAEIAAGERDVPAEQKIVFDAMHYGLTGGGKRIRPVLCLSVCEMLGGDLQMAAGAAYAIECVHNYSLIHDDLPCMDDDDLRRGRPTCHMVFPENIALLAGDGLLTQAFAVLSDRSRFAGVGAEVQLQLMRELSSAAGADGMIGGQTIDLLSEEREDISLALLEKMHRLKTGALIRCAARMGCILAGYAEEEGENLQKISTFSEKLGLAFQIKDDILDVIGDEQVFGKPVGSDASNEKKTFVTLLGLQKAEEKLRTLTKEATDALDVFGKDAWFLRELADFLLTRDH